MSGPLDSRPDRARTTGALPKLIRVAMSTHTRFRLVSAFNSSSPRIWELNYRISFIAAFIFRDHTKEITAKAARALKVIRNALTVHSMSGSIRQLPSLSSTRQAATPFITE